MTSIRPVIAAAREGKRIALANKELLVMAGKFLVEAARAGGGGILPVDSEHSAVFQAIEGHRKQDISRIILTASGGPFRNRTFRQMRNATVEEALGHPTWRMGAKISVDSATLMNKGFEVIEAMWLFDLPPDRIDVLIHPQSIVHSMVEYRDGSLIAQLGVPDMRIPIGYALSYPERLPWNCPVCSRIVWSAGCSNRRTGRASPPSPWRTPRRRPGGRRPRRSTPRTRSRWPPFSPGGSGSRTSSGWRRP